MNQTQQEESLVEILPKQLEKRKQKEGKNAYHPSRKNFNTKKENNERKRKNTSLENTENENLEESVTSLKEDTKTRERSTQRRKTKNTRQAVTTDNLNFQFKKSSLKII